MPAERTARHAEVGAALLVALLVVALVGTAAIVGVALQWRATRIEAAERERVQATWLLDGALQWALQVLEADRQGDASGVDHRGEAWALPLAETRLTDWLEAGGPQANEPAFLSGAIDDLQGRFNLRNLVRDSVVQSDVRAGLERLCVRLGVEAAVADRIAVALNAALVRAATRTDLDAPLLPPWDRPLEALGIDAADARRLAPHVVLLPQRTPLNLNTASPDALAALLGSADAVEVARLPVLRERRPFTRLAQIETVLPGLAPLDPEVVGLGSDYFEVRTQLRVATRWIEQRALVERRAGPARVLQRVQRAGDGPIDP